MATSTPDAPSGPPPTQNVSPLVTTASLTLTPKVTTAKTATTLLPVQQTVIDLTLQKDTTHTSLNSKPLFSSSLTQFPQIGTKRSPSPNFLATLQQTRGRSPSPAFINKPSGSSHPQALSSQSLSPSLAMLQHSHSDTSVSSHTHEAAPPPAKKKRLFHRELMSMMRGFGDDPNPYSETVDLIEELVIRFITEMTQKAMEVGRTGRVQVNDIIFIIRKDKKKYSRVKDLLTMKEQIDKAKKAFIEDAETSDD